MDADLRGGAGRVWAAQRVKLLQVFRWHKKRRFTAFFAEIHAVSRWRLFLTVTLITALLSGWFQVVCFLHKFSLARVRPRLLRQYRERTHYQSALGGANEHVI
jgi:hypothetical protein